METTDKLPEEFKARFVAELRSGKHKQGKKVLYNQKDDTLCCLGVAGLLCGLTKDEMAGIDILTMERTTNRPKGILSKKALERMGYPRILTASGENNVAVNLAEKNDEGESFSEIADYIETNL